MWQRTSTPSSPPSATWAASPSGSPRSGGRGGRGGSIGPARTARFAAHRRGTDRYTLAYEHAPDGMSWSWSRAAADRSEGRYTLERLDAGRTRVTYDLTIHHNLPLPGFLRSRVKGLVDETLKGLQARLEGAR